MIHCIITYTWHNLEQLERDEITDPFLSFNGLLDM